MRSLKSLHSLPLRRTWVIIQNKVDHPALSFSGNSLLFLTLKCLKNTVHSMSQLTLDDILNAASSANEEKLKSQEKAIGKTQTKTSNKTKSQTQPSLDKSEASKGPKAQPKTVAAQEKPKPQGEPSVKNLGESNAQPQLQSLKIEKQTQGAQASATAEPEVNTSEAAPEEEQQNVFSVSDINAAIKSQLEGNFSLLWLKGELSNFKAHSSGHFYFSLKDSKAQINAVMFKGFNRHVKFKPTDGMEVLVRGKITVYEPRGNYQVFCEVMEPVGVGALQIAFEQLKKKLQAEGLFDKAKKRALPQLPRKVALVTSPTGAAIRDMLNVLGRRMKALEVTIFPCAVQGVHASKEIAKAIEMANQIGGFDVMIVGRGGGSIEDLWAFNEEIVARALAASQIPTVSAVGHEIDFTISDFVADLRAPTPSAAAELISQNAEDVQAKIRTHFKNLYMLMTKSLQAEKQKVLFFSKRLVDPRRKLQDLVIRCDELAERLTAAILRGIEVKKLKLTNLRSRVLDPAHKILLLQQKLQQTFKTLKLLVYKNLSFKRERFVELGTSLDSMSPLKVLERGYSVVKHKKKIIRDIQEVSVGDEVQVLLSNGVLETQVINKKERGSDV